MRSSRDLTAGSAKEGQARHMDAINLPSGGDSLPNEQARDELQVLARELALCDGGRRFLGAARAGVRCCCRVAPAVARHSDTGNAGAAE